MDVTEKNAAGLFKKLKAFMKFLCFLFSREFICARRNVFEWLYICKSTSCFCNFILQHIRLPEIQVSKKTLGSLHGVNVLSLKLIVSLLSL